ncbi:MAG: UDP-3-O-(3-hydroxymyristoyl)glucosamine N-acyltransferase [Alphaproteobacteria bacterium]|nr:MAG: UDP-3-O-(3-hydroxymyristoyl)glucosamine N-acyltransferase [Alphaproteobacteria bacterium]
MDGQEPGYSIAEVAAAIGAEAVGRTDLRVRGVSEPASAGPNELALAMDRRYAEGLAEGQARAAVLWPGADWQGLGLEAAIFAPLPKHALAAVTGLFEPGPEVPEGIDPSAVIAPDAEIGPGARIGPLVVIGPGVRIGAGAVIGAHVSIGAGSRIGPEARLGAGVRIGPRVRIGARFRAQPGAVIGSDGFSYAQREEGAIEAVRRSLGAETAARLGPWARVASLGSVVIGDDVEIGANSCIDRGTVADTVIGSGTKIDNLVQIGHNCRIGRDCLICGMSGLSGSAVLGDRVVLGGMCGVADHVRIGDNVMAGGATRIHAYVAPGKVIVGNPMMPLETWVRTQRLIRRLPRMAEELAELRRRLAELSQEADSG